MGTFSSLHSAGTLQGTLEVRTNQRSADWFSNGSQSGNFRVHMDSMGIY